MRDVNSETCQHFSTGTFMHSFAVEAPPSLDTPIKQMDA